MIHLLTKFQNTSLPGNPNKQAHSAEVLRQVEGAEVVPGGWVGGDAWFGSVMTCVEVKKQFNAYSTFIVKPTQHFFQWEHYMRYYTVIDLQDIG
jgi:hypothetical protein